MPEQTLLTQAEYARRRNVTRQAVSKAVRTGKIPTVKGRIPAEVADDQWRINTDPSKKTPGPPEGNGRPSSAAQGYATSRALREAYAARLAKLDYEERIGNLLPAGDVQRGIFEEVRRARDRLLTVPSRVAALAAAETDPAAVHRLLDAEIRTALEELGRVEGVAGGGDE